MGAGEAKTVGREFVPIDERSISDQSFVERRSALGGSYCRLCESTLETTMVDLGMHPLCESFLTLDRVDDPEVFFPLHVKVCGNCFLAQVGEYESPENIFDDYAYFSSYSTSWLEHAEQYVEMMVERFELGLQSKILEIGSNDGYLLQYFLRAGYEVLGIEPAATVRSAAEGLGIQSIGEFFNEELGSRLAGDGYTADVVIGNNVLAQIPDINSFVAGVSLVLSRHGVATFEFPHLMRLIERNEFDTIYHEHFSYFSLGTASRVMAAHGLEIFDVEELPTHGGSLRVFVKHSSDSSKPVLKNVASLLQAEDAAGLFELATYQDFARQAAKTKRELLRILIEAKDRGDSVVIYGAAGKGNTLLNYCGIGTDIIDYACDKNPYKHGRYTPGTHIQIFDPARIAQTKPNLILILPWNLKDEIMKQLSYVSEWGASFVVPIPEPEVFAAGSY